MVQKPRGDYQQSSTSKGGAGEPNKKPFWKKEKRGKGKRTQDDRQDRDKCRVDPPPNKKAKKDARKPDKGESISSYPSTPHFLDLATDFASIYAAGAFSDEAISMVEKAGLSLDGILETATLPVAGRISTRQPSWGQITENGWALSVVSNGLRLDWKKGPPTTPHRTRNPPMDTRKEGFTLFLLSKIF